MCIAVSQNVQTWNETKYSNSYKRQHNNNVSAENAGPENAGHKNAVPNDRCGKCRT